VSVGCRCGRKCRVTEATSLAVFAPVEPNRRPHPSADHLQQLLVGRLVDAQHALEVVGCDSQAGCDGDSEWISHELFQQVRIGHGAVKQREQGFYIRGHGAPEWCASISRLLLPLRGRR
jgi:hypothetical protein